MWKQQEKESTRSETKRIQVLTSGSQNSTNKIEEKIVEEKQIQFSQVNAQEISTNYSYLGIQKSKDRKPAQWTLEEDRELFRNYLEIGSKWIDIAESFPTKNDNDCKNRFYCCIRKVLKWVNQYQKQTRHKKMVSIDSLLTVLEIGKFNYNLFDERFIEVKKNIDQILQVRTLIIELAIKPSPQVLSQELETLVLKLTHLKYSLKFINIKRVKRSACRRGRGHPGKIPMEENLDNPNSESVLSLKSSVRKEGDQIFSVIRTVKNQWVSKALQKLKHQNFQLKSELKKQKGVQIGTLLQNSQALQMSSCENIELKDWTLEESATEYQCSCIMCLDSKQLLTQGGVFYSN